MDLAEDTATEAKLDASCAALRAVMLARTPSNELYKGMLVDLLSSMIEFAGYNALRYRCNLYMSSSHVQ